MTQKPGAGSRNATPNVSRSGTPKQPIAGSRNCAPNLSRNGSPGPQRNLSDRIPSSDSLASSSSSDDSEGSECGPEEKTPGRFHQVVTELVAENRRHSAPSQPVKGASFGRRHSVDLAVARAATFGTFAKCSECGAPKNIAKDTSKGSGQEGIELSRPPLPVSPSFGNVSRKHTDPVAAAWIAKIQESDEIKQRRRQACHSMMGQLEARVPEVSNLEPDDRVLVLSMLDKEVDSLEHNLACVAYDQIVVTLEELETMTNELSEKDNKMAMMNQAYLKEISAQRDCQRVPHWGAQEATEEADRRKGVEYYEPLEFMSSEFRRAVMVVTEEKLKAIFSYDPDLKKGRYNEVEMLRAELASNEQMFEELEKAINTHEKMQEEMQQRLKESEVALFKANQVALTAGGKTKMTPATEVARQQESKLLGESQNNEQPELSEQRQKETPETTGASEQDCGELLSPKTTKLNAMMAERDEVQKKNALERDRFQNVVQQHESQVALLQKMLAKKVRSDSQLEKVTAELDAEVQKRVALEQRVEELNAASSTTLSRNATLEAALLALGPAPISPAADKSMLGCSETQPSVASVALEPSSGHRVLAVATDSHEIMEASIDCRNAQQNQEKNQELSELVTILKAQIQAVVTENIIAHTALSDFQKEVQRLTRELLKAFPNSPEETPGDIPAVLTEMEKVAFSGGGAHFLLQQEAQLRQTATKEGGTEAGLGRAPEPSVPGTPSGAAPPPQQSWRKGRVQSRPSSPTQCPQPPPVDTRSQSMGKLEAFTKDVGRSASTLTAPRTPRTPRTPRPQVEVMLEANAIDGGGSGTRSRTFSRSRTTENGAVSLPELPRVSRSLSCRNISANT